MNFNINFSIFLFAPPDEVMELLTNPDFIKDWGGGNAIVEKMEGGKFEMFDGWVSGQVLKITGDELAYTWRTTEWEENAPASEVHYKLEARDHGTELFVNHLNLPSQKEADDHQKGWKEYFFEPIGEYLANRKF